VMYAVVWRWRTARRSWADRRPAAWPYCCKGKNRCTHWWTLQRVRYPAIFNLVLLALVILPVLPNGLRSYGCSIRSKSADGRADRGISVGGYIAYKFLGLGPARCCGVLGA